MSKPVHYVPVSEQLYARIIETLEQRPDPADWTPSLCSGIADDLAMLANSFNMDPGTTPIVMAVDRVRSVAISLRSVGTINPPKLAACLASFVQRC